MDASIPECSHERPYHGPDQVRTVRGIKPGNILIMAARGDKGFRKRILIVSKPYVSFLFGKPCIEYDFLILNGRTKGWLMSGFTSDSGVTPYHSGMWNTRNYMLRAHRKRLSEEQIDLKIKKLFVKGCLDCRRP
jgi:hypothetical protein